MENLTAKLKVTLSALLCVAVLIPLASCQTVNKTAEALTALSEHMEEIGMFAHYDASEVYLSDVTGDGKNDYCVTVTMGSGIVSEMIVVYDAYGKVLYELNGREDGLNYTIVNAFNNNLNVMQTLIFCEEGDSNEGIPGRAVLENGELVFKPNH